MKTYLFLAKLIFVLVTLILNAAFAQVQENQKKVLGSQVKMYIKYDLEHMADSLKKDVPIKRSMYLYIGAEGSYFTPLEINRSKELGGVPFGMDETDQSDAIVQLFTDFENPSQPFIVAFIGKPFKVYPKSNPAIDWKIGTEEKSIGGYLCHKAVGQFGGRTYEAWFTEEIPYSVGPWKLNGLPGAILEAADTKKEVQFFYAGLDVVKDKLVLFEKKSLPELTYEKYKKSLENSKLDKVGSMLANLPPDAKVEFKTEDGRSISQEEAEMMMKGVKNDVKKFNLNNPADLTSK